MRCRFRGLWSVGLGRWGLRGLFWWVEVRMAGMGLLWKWALLTLDALGEDF